MSLLKLTAAAVALVAMAGPAAEVANGGTPTLTVRVGDAAVKIERHEAPGRGPVTLALRRDGERDPRSVAVVELKPGKTAADLAAIPLGGLADASRVAAVGRLVGGTTVTPGADVRITILARARGYVVVDVTDEANPSAAFTVADEDRGARAVRPDAAITLLDDGIQMPAALPRDGVIRVRNAGRRPHHALAIRLKARFGIADATRRLRAGATPQSIGAPIDLMGLLSPGIAADVERRLAPGRYLVTSFYAGTGARAEPDILRGVLGETRVR